LGETVTAVRTTSVWGVCGSGLKVVAAGLIAIAQFGEPNALAAPRGHPPLAACQLSGRLGSALIVTDSGDHWLLVNGRATRLLTDEKSAEAEIVLERSWAPDERVGGGMAELADGNRD